VHDFGSHLRALRETAGLTQEELAERAGVTSYAISALERGRRQRPYPHTVRSLADALGASDEQRARLLASVPRRGVLPARRTTRHRSRRRPPPFRRSAAVGRRCPTPGCAS
jgi:transcriptional regulator with XRE-family HTH domain